MPRNGIAPDEQLDDVFHEELIRKLTRDALDALDAVLDGDPNLSGRVVPQLETRTSSRDVAVTIEIKRYGATDALSLPFRPGTPKAGVLRQLRYLADDLDPECSDDLDDEG